MTGPNFLPSDFSHHLDSPDSARIPQEKKGTPRDADLPVSSGKTSMAGLEIAILGNDQWIDTKLNHNAHLAMLKG
jgi:hypothetical protein